MNFDKYTDRSKGHGYSSSLISVPWVFSNPPLPDRPPKLSYSAAAAASATVTSTNVSENVGALPRSA